MAGFELPRFTTTPALGAGAARRTVPVTDEPPETLVRLSVSEETALCCGAGLTVNVVVLVTPPSDAEMLVTVWLATDEVVIPKLALLAPCGTGTLAGTVTALLALDSETLTAAVAGPVSVTVPVDELPPST